MAHFILHPYLYSDLAITYPINFISAISSPLISGPFVIISEITGHSITTLLFLNEMIEECVFLHQKGLWNDENCRSNNFAVLLHFPFHLFHFQCFCIDIEEINGVERFSYAFAISCVMNHSQRFQGCLVSFIVEIKIRKAIFTWAYVFLSSSNSYIFDIVHKL